jgi:hypothetical protein
VALSLSVEMNDVVLVEDRVRSRGGMVSEANGAEHAYLCNGTRATRVRGHVRICASIF